MHWMVSMVVGGGITELETASSDSCRDLWGAVANDLTVTVVTDLGLTLDTVGLASVG